MILAAAFPLVLVLMSAPKTYACSMDDWSKINFIRKFELCKSSEVRLQDSCRIQIRLLESPMDSIEDAVMQAEAEIEKFHIPDSHIRLAQFLEFELIPELGPDPSEAERTTRLDLLKRTRQASGFQELKSVYADFLKLKLLPVPRHLFSSTEKDELDALYLIAPGSNLAKAQQAPFEVFRKLPSEVCTQIDDKLKEIHPGLKGSAAVVGGSSLPEIAAFRCDMGRVTLQEPVFPQKIAYSGRLWDPKVEKLSLTAYQEFLAVDFARCCRASVIRRMEVDSPSAQECSRWNIKINSPQKRQPKKRGVGTAFQRSTIPSLDNTCV